MSVSGPELMLGRLYSNGGEVGDIEDAQFEGGRRELLLDLCDCSLSSLLTRRRTGSGEWLAMMMNVTNNEHMMGREGAEYDA